MTKTVQPPEGYYTLKNGDKMKEGDILFRYTRWEALSPLCVGNTVSERTYQIARKIESTKTSLLPDGYYILPAGERTGPSDLMFRDGVWRTLGLASHGYDITQYTYPVARKIEKMELKELQEQIKQQQISINNLRVQEAQLLIKDAEEKGFVIGASLDNGGIITNRIIINDTKDTVGLSLNVKDLWQKTPIAFVAVVFMLGGSSRSLPLCDVKVRPKSKLPTLYGYEGVYHKGAKFVIYGCAHIDVGMLRQMHTMMVTSQYGNRKIAGVTLDSGKVLTYSDVKAIMTYVDYTEQA